MGYENTLPFIRNYRVVILGSKSASGWRCFCLLRDFRGEEHRKPGTMASNTNYSDSD